MKQRLNQPASFDRANLERHVMALLVHGLRDNLAPAESAAREVRARTTPARRPRRKIS